MKIGKLILPALALALPCMAAGGVHTDNTKIKTADLFGIQFENGSTYFARASMLVSASRHEYLIGGMLVTEVVLDFNGSKSLLRIYNMRPADQNTVLEQVAPNTPPAVAPYLNRAEEASERLDRAREKVKDTYVPNAVPGQGMVAKVYPATTHAHTVEYAVAKIEDLDLFYIKLCMDSAASKNIFSLNKKFSKLAEDAAKIDSVLSMAKKLYIFADEQDKE